MFAKREETYGFGKKEDTFAKRVYTYYTTGFFTPYKNFKDAGLAVAPPIVLPVLAGLVAPLLLLGAAVASLVFVGGLLTAAGAYAFNSEIAGDGLYYGLMAGAVSLICAAAIILVGVLAALATAGALTKTLSRTATTLVASSLDCLPHSSVKEIELTQYPR